MTVDERLRDASAQLRTATDSLCVPEPRFAQPIRDRRPTVPAFVIGVIAIAVVVIGFTVWRDPDRKGQLSTVAPTTVPAEPEANVPLPDVLPKLTGSSIKSVRTLLASLKLNFEMSAEAGGDLESGRVVAQDPPAGTALSPFVLAHGVVRLTVGAPLAVAVDEIDVGLTGDSPQGRWRVVASEGAGGYCVAVFNQDNTMLSCISSLADLQTSAFGPNFNSAVGVYAGSAPAGTTTVELVDASGQVAATATVSNSASPWFHGLVFWAAVASQPNLKIKVSGALSFGDPTRCVGSGDTTVKVPDATGQLLRDAINMMRQAGLDVVGDGVPDGDPTGDEARVRTQEPEPGTSAARGDCVGFRTTR